MNGIKDGSQYGLKRGGRGRNRTDECRNPEIKQSREIIEDKQNEKELPNKIIDKILGK